MTPATFRMLCPKSELVAGGLEPPPSPLLVLLDRCSGYCPCLHHAHLGRQMPTLHIHLNQQLQVYRLAPVAFLPTSRRLVRSTHFHLLRPR